MHWQRSGQEDGCSDASRAECMENRLHGKRKPRALAVLASLLGADTYTITRGGRSQTSSAAGNGGAAGEEWTLWLWDRLVECGILDNLTPNISTLHCRLSRLLHSLKGVSSGIPNTQEPLCDPHRWYRRLHRVNCATRH